MLTPFVMFMLALSWVVVYLTTLLRRERLERRDLQRKMVEFNAELDILRSRISNQADRLGYLVEDVSVLRRTTTHLANHELARHTSESNAEKSSFPCAVACRTRYERV